MIERPSHIRPEHWQEWRDSCVSPGIIALNVRSVSDIEVDRFTHEVTTPIADLLNWKFTRFGEQVKPNIHGWIVQGIDPATGDRMDWLRFKPDSDTPIIDRKKGEAAKYLSPKGQPSRVTFLRVDRESWQRISEKCGVPMPTKEQEFWEWVKENVAVPISLTEGEKKAGCLLSWGYAAIALPGINAGVRTRDKNGNSTPARLIPELEPFAQPGRPWYICFDYETKPKTIQAVNREIEKLKTQLTRRGGEVKIVNLPGPQKGVDDFIAAQGIEAFDRAYKAALTFEQWQVQRLSRLTAPVDLSLNQRYLGKLPIPDGAKLVCIKSPKGSGKTESFVEMAAAATANGQRALLLTHRVQLGQAICDRIGLPYVTELRTAGEGDLLGYGLCVDSLHPESQARFNADDWHGALVIIDECEQVLWHLLSATTEVNKRRMPIIDQFKQLLINTFEHERGRVILSDADLSDLSLEFIWGLIEERVQPWVVVNTQKAQEPWLINHYPDKNPERCFTALHNEIESGGRVFVVTQSQSKKGRWSTTNLEAWAKRRHPDKRVLRIDSQSIADPTHEAYLCTSKLNEVLPKYDIVIASPSIETGVSIDIRGHFDSVWGFLNGVTPENSARQALARVRDPVPRHIWIARYGLGRVANGSSSMKAILKGEYEVSRIAAKLIQVVEFDESLISAYSSSLKVWAKMAARINAGVINYRESVLRGLEAEGHIINEGEATTGVAELVAELQVVRDEQYLEECEAVASAEDLTEAQYEELQGKKAKTEADWQKQHKHNIKQRYQVEVTPELVAKDNDGWYPKLRLLYFLSFGRQFLQERDRQSLEQASQTGGMWLPTINRSQYSTKIAIFEALGVKCLLNPDREFSGGTKKLDYENASPEVLRIAELAKNHCWEIRNFLGITVSEKMSPIQITQALLGKLGIKLTCHRQEGSAGYRERIYRYIAPKDGRDEILQGWFTRDDATRNQSEMHTPGISNQLPQVTGRSAA